MDALDALKGNDRTKEYFRAEAENGSLAHAYILEGEEGTGKHTLAYAVAQIMAPDTPEGRKIGKGTSPDVKVYGVSGDRKQLTVDVIRAIKEDAYIKPNDLPFRFYIIEQAEMMNVQAQNAALKLLEEPPEATYFFLLTASAPALLPTVRSRAPVIRMERFSPETLRLLLKDEINAAKNKGVDRAFIEGCLRSAGGSIGRAKTLLSEKNDKGSSEQVKELFGLVDKEAELLLFSLKLPQKRQEFDKFLALLQSALRDILMIRSGAGTNGLLYFNDAAEAETAGKGLAKESLLLMNDCVSALREDLSRNVNIQNARLALAAGLYRAAVS